MSEQREMNDEPIILTIALIGGTGNHGPGLALRWANAGYRIIIGSREEQKAKATAAELNNKLGIESIQGMQNAQAVENANISVLCVVASAHDEILRGLRELLQGKILVDVASRVLFPTPVVPESPSAARAAQEILGTGVKVTAAFQNVPSHLLQENLDEPLDLDVLIFADDPEAARETILLAEAGGMIAYHAGGLDNAIVAEGMTAVLIELNRRYKGKNAAYRITGIEK